MRVTFSVAFAIVLGRGEADFFVQDSPIFAFSDCGVLNVLPITTCFMRVAFHCLVSPHNGNNRLWGSLEKGSNSDASVPCACVCFMSL